MGVCDFPLMNEVCTVADGIDFAQDPGAAITDGIGAWIAKSSGELAAAGADLAAKAVDKTTGVDLNADWFRDNYELILPIGLTLTVGTFCAQLIRAAWRRDGQALSHAFTGTIIGVLFAFAAVACTSVALTVVDALSDGLFKAANSSISDAVRRIVQVNQYGSLHELGWMVSALTAIGAAVGAFLYWCVMMVRKVGILVLVTLAVFAGAGGGWEVAQRWRKGWIEITASLIVSKLLMTIIFLLGISAMGKSPSGGGVAALSDAMAGIVVIVLVLLCPYATYKFVHWAADGSSADLHQSSGAGIAAASRHTQNAARKAAAMGATGGAAGAGMAAAPQGPPSVPGQGSEGIAPTGHDDSNGNDTSGGAKAEGDCISLDKGSHPDDSRQQQAGTGETNPLAGAPDGAWEFSAGPNSTTPPPQGGESSTPVGASDTGPATPAPPPQGD